MSCPSISANTIGDFGPDSLYPYDDLGRLGTFDWIEVDKAVGGGVDRWNDFDDHRADTVPWIIRHVLNADDPQRHADVDRIPGPAGPIYEVINGRHRTHAMRILGVPLMVAEVVGRPLPVPVYQTVIREAGCPTYPAIPMWRGLMDRGRWCTGPGIQMPQPQACLSKEGVRTAFVAAEQHVVGLQPLLARVRNGSTGLLSTNRDRPDERDESGSSTAQNAVDTSMALRARMLDMRVHKETKDIGEEPSAVPVRKSSSRAAASSAAR